MFRRARLSVVAACMVAFATAGVRAAADAKAAEAEGMIKEIEAVKFPPVTYSWPSKEAMEKYIADYYAAVDQRKTLVEGFEEKFPHNPKVPGLYLALAKSADLRVDMKHSRYETQIALYRHILEKYKGTAAATAAAGPVRVADAIGKPFKLNFQDAITGKRVTTASLKGKVVVVDFWATWCPPCVQEMPENKKIYEKYHDKGVEFVGISLDLPPNQGGLKALKKFVADNQIPWPQDYLGQSWSSEFVKTWDVHAIPTLFLVDAQGNLVTPMAWGHVEELIDEQLSKGAAARADVK